MDEVRLYFSIGRVLRLLRIESSFGSTRHVATARGSAMPAAGVGIFRWSRGVKVVSILFVQQALASLDSTVGSRIEGRRGSIAASLDGALSQEPLWLVEMFGLLSDKKPRCRRIFVRSNPGLKRQGPVAVSLSPSLRSQNVRIFLNNAPTSSKRVLEEILTQLMDQAF